ncbi:hypothetical protein VaNZ11_011072 [Volvox africanus]|uniref:Guanylate cyclase domain-containing protein n=1 Tax=Volvox africanus TaxID=51714 RepID=A0ABQ5SB51_9CHLO|nr:hypothetical protein VaNZ11_011072 [Volvox africanus]
MLRSQLRCFPQQSAQPGLAFLLLAVIFLDPCYSAQTGSGNATCCTGLLCGLENNSSKVPEITILSGLRPNAPHLQTLAREQTHRALAAVRDPRLSRVQLGGDAGAGDVLQQEGPGISGTWYSPAGDVDLELLWDVRYLNDTSAQMLIAAAAADPVRAAGRAVTPVAAFRSPWNARLCGALEYMALPLLRAHSSGNTSWLEQLEAAAAAGEHPLSNEMLVPRPGKPGGPAAVPLLLLYRRDWWRALLAKAGGGSSDPSAEEEVAVLPPTWPLLVQLVSELLNRDLDGDGRQDHVLCVDLMPGCKGWALLSAIFASLVQTNGTEQGVWFNLTDLMPALGGPALPTALRLYGGLAASNAAPFTPGGPSGSRSSVPVAPSELLAGGGAVDAATGAPLCGAINPLFAAGRCLFTIDWAAAALRLTKEAAPGIAGLVGAALLPGSAAVAVAPTIPSPSFASTLASAPTPAPSPASSTPSSYFQKLSPAPSRVVYEGGNGITAAIQPCSATTCPYGDVVSEVASTALAAVMNKTATARAVPRYVNRAALVGDATNIWLLGLGQSVDSFIQTDDFIRLVGFQLELKYTALLHPLQGQQHSAAAATYVGESGQAIPTMRVVYPGMPVDLESSDARAVLKAVNASVTHPNAAMDILLPYSSSYRSIIDDLATAAAELLLTTSDSESKGAAAAGSAAAGNNATSALSSQLEALIATAAMRLVNVRNAFPYPVILQHLYLHSIGASSPNGPSEPPGGGGGGRGGGRIVPWRLAVAVALSIAGFLGLAVAAACLVASLRRRWRAKRRPASSCRTKPPGAGPATTLALTDVQSSTMLWEVLSAELMDACMSIHHGIMRKAIEYHSGYEVFTEGDAFAVAFHGPGDALGFALDVQAAMLAADWPPELLDHPEACEVWARRNSHLNWTASISNAAAAATAAAAGASGVGSPRRITGAGIPSVAGSGGGGGGSGSNAGGSNVGGTGGGLENSLIGLSRLTKGSKRLRALLGGGSSKGEGSSSAAGGGNAAFLTSGDSFWTPGSAAVLRLLPSSNTVAAAAAATAARQNSPQSQRPFSSFLSRLDATTMSLGLVGNPSTVTAARAAAEVEMAAALAQYGSMAQAPWNNGGPRPIMSLTKYDWFRNTPTNGSSAVDWRPGDNANNPALRMGRVFRRQSAEGIGPWDSPVIPRGLASGPVVPRAATSRPLTFANLWAAGVSAAQPGLPGQSESPTPNGHVQSFAYGTWGGSNTIGPMPPPQMGLWNAQMRVPPPVWLPPPPTILRVGGELLERSVSLSPPPHLPHPLRIPMAYLAASRSAGAGGCGAAPRNAPPMRPMHSLKPPKPQDDNGTAVATATPTPTLGTTTSSARRPGRRCPPVKCASIGPSSLIRPFSEVPSLPRTSGGGNFKESLIRTEAPSPLLPMTVELPPACATGASVEVARTAPASTSASAQRAATEDLTPNEDLSSSSPFQGAASLATTPAASSHPLQPPSPHLRPAASGQAGESSQPVAVAVATPGQAQIIRRQYSGIIMSPTALQSPQPSPLVSQLPPPASQQQAHHRRGAVRTASRLSLVTMDRNADAAAAQRGCAGRRNRLLSLFHPGQRNTVVSAAAVASQFGPVQYERSPAALTLQRQASFTAISSRLGGASSMALASGRSLSFTARQRPDPDRLWPPTGVTRGSQLHAIISGSSGRAVESSWTQAASSPQSAPVSHYYQHQHQQQGEAQRISLTKKPQETSEGEFGEASRSQERRSFQRGHSGLHQDQQLRCAYEPVLVSDCAATLARMLPQQQSQQQQPIPLRDAAENHPTPGDVSPQPSNAASTSTAVPIARRVSFKLSGLSSATSQEPPRPHLNSDPDPEPDPESDLLIPDRIPGRDWSLHPWLDLQAVRSGGDMYSTRELFGGLPRLAEGHEGDEGTASGTRTFECTVTSPASRPLASREDWHWPQVGPRTDMSTSSLPPSVPPSQPLLSAAAAVLAGLRPDAQRGLVRTSSSSSRRRSTGCSFESSGSAGDLLRALHHEAGSVKAARRRSASAAVSGPSGLPTLAPRVPHVTSTWRPDDPATATTSTSTMAMPPPPNVGELVDATTMKGLIFSAAAVPDPAAQAAVRSIQAARRSGGGGNEHDDQGRGKLIAVDVDVLLEAERVLVRTGGGGGGSSRDIKKNNIISQVRRSCSAVAAGDVAEPHDANVGYAAANGRRHGSAAAANATEHRRDLAAALDRFDDGGGGQLLEWRSVVTWEVDLEEVSEPLGFDLMATCQPALQGSGGGGGGLSQHLPVLSTGVATGREADGSQAGGGGGPASNRSAFFRSWRNMAGGGAPQQPCEFGAAAQPPARRHACNGSSAIASSVSVPAAATAIGGGISAGVVRTNSFLHAGDTIMETSSQDDLRRNSNNAGSGRLLTRLGHAVRKAVLRGTLGDRDRDRERDREFDELNLHPHPHSEGTTATTASGACPARNGRLGSSSWLRRPSRLRLSKDAGLGASAGGRAGDGSGGASFATADGAGEAGTRAGSSTGSRTSSASSGSSRSGKSDPIAGVICCREGGSAEDASGSGGAGVGGGGEPRMDDDVGKEVEEYGAEVSTQSNAPWESTATAEQLAAASNAATAAAAGLVLPHLGPSVIPSMALAVLANDFDDARQYYMRPEYMLANGGAMLRGNVGASTAVAPPPAAPTMPRTAAEDSVFDLLWRDLNAAASGPYSGGNVFSPPPPPSGERPGPSTGWPQAAAATVASALRLLFEQLTHAEAVLSYIMEGGSGVHRENGYGGSSAPELVLRGLRIRIGLHSGPREGEVELSVVDRVSVGRYRGDFLATCKEVSEAAVGGMVILSGAAFRAYHQLRTRARQQQQDALMLLHVGDHIVRSAAHADQDITRASIAMAAASELAAPARELYTAVSPGLLARLAVLPSPVRTAREVVPGCLSAPAGVVAPVFCNVVGVEALIAWEKVLMSRMLRKGSTNTGLPNHSHPHHEHVPHQPLQRQQTGEALSTEGDSFARGVVHIGLDILRKVVSEVAAMHDGYVVASSADGGHWVLVFGSAENAVLWGLGMLEAMLAAAWPEGLLDHEVTEEVWEGSTLLRRGLRLRIGIDCGAAMIRLVPRTGRLDYVGRPLNRAARIAAKAKAATVLVSDAVWVSARASLEPVVVPASLGLVQLKGVKEPLELWALKTRTAGGSGDGGKGVSSGNGKTT